MLLLRPHSTVASRLHHGRAILRSRPPLGDEASFTSLDALPVSDKSGSKMFKFDSSYHFLEEILTEFLLIDQAEVSSPPSVSAGKKSVVLTKGILDYLTSFLLQIVHLTPRARASLL